MKRLEEIPGVEKEADRDKGGEEIWNQTIIGVMARYLWVLSVGVTCLEFDFKKVILTVNEKVN